MNKNYITGFIGSLIGGIIFSIPWIGLYVYANMMFSILGGLIGLGAYIFYKLFNGKIGKPTKWIIILSSIISITISTFVIIPMLLIVKQGFGISLYYFKFIYKSYDFVSAIIFDYFISFVFTLLGISGVISKINSDIATETGEELINIEEKSFEEKVEYVQKIYEKYDAFSKDKRVSEFKILKDLKVHHKFKFLIEMEKEGVIISPFIKSYMNKDVLKDRKGAKKLARKNIVISVVCGLFVGIIVGLSLVFLVVGLTDKPSNNEIKYKTYSYKNISIELPDSFSKMSDSAWNDSNNSAAFLSPNTDITQVILQEEVMSDISYDFEKFVALYKEYLNNSFEILNSNKVTIDNKTAYKINVKSRKYVDEYYFIYVVNNNNLYEYIWMFKRRDKDISDIEFSLYEKEADNYSKTIKINELQNN